MERSQNTHQLTKNIYHHSYHDPTTTLSHYPNPNIKTPKKSGQQNVRHIINTSRQILQKQPYEQTSRWLIEHKITSTLLKYEKMLPIINISKKVYQQMIVYCQKGTDQYITKVINHFHNSNTKSYEFFKCLKYYSFKDPQFQFIVASALETNQVPISFYLACQSAIVGSYLNKTKRENMGSVMGNEQQWFKVLKKIFTKQIKEPSKQKYLVQLFVQTVKNLYSEIKLSNSDDSFFKICQVCYSCIYHDNQQKLQEQVRQQSYDEQLIIGNKNGKIEVDQKKVKRIFDRNLINGLNSEDREFIRALSYRDQNIATLLEKKHQKMIQMIADQVESLRDAIQKEKEAHIQMQEEKQQIIKTSDSINSLILSYIEDKSMKKEKQVVDSIKQFTNKYGKKTQTQRVEQLADRIQQLRLIEIIEGQQKQTD